MRGKKNSNLTEGPIAATLLQLTLPTILGGLGMVIFNVTDTYFVGRLGTEQLAALSFTFPVVLFATSIAHGIGIGVSANVSRAIGGKNDKEAKRITTDGLGLAFLLVSIMSVLGLLTIDGLFSLMGASSAELPHIKNYMTIWYCGAVFMVVPMVANNAIRALGDSKTPGLIVICAASVNIVLDPLLIFGLAFFPQMGVTGAAVATVISRGVMMVFSFVVLFHKKKMISSESPTLHRVWKSWKQILYIGVPSAGTKIALPFATGVMTRILATYGSEAVAGFGVATRIEVFALMVITALATVMGPFIGQNYGAGKYERIRTGLGISYRLSLFWGVATIVILAIWGAPIGSIFSRDPAVNSIVKLYLLIVPIGYGVYGLFAITTSVMSVLQKPLHAALVTLAQTFLFLLPLAYICSVFVGLWGVFLAIPISSLIAGLLGWTILDRILNTRKSAVAY